jgi:hypothetical protein
MENLAALDPEVTFSVTAEMPIDGFSVAVRIDLGTAYYAQKRVIVPSMNHAAPALQ